MASSRVSLKLLIDTKSNRVLFAEAGKDFVDFLFRIFTLPVGAVVSLIKKQETAGSLTTLHKSIENLSDSYVQPNQNKDAVLKPVPMPALISDAPASLANGKKFYWCSCSESYVYDEQITKCPNCFEEMTTVLSYVAPPLVPRKSERGGFVKGMMTYMVTDDLAVTPCSSISSIALLNRFGVKDVSTLKEMVVGFGNNEAVELLNTSLNSKEVLTKVFLKEIKREV